MAREERRLAVITFADVVNFSRLTEVNEPQAIKTARNLGLRLEQLAREHQGRLVKSMGDGYLIEFQSSLEAVNFAIATQKSLHQNLWEELGERHPDLRIGIHMGDVEHIKGDVYGDTVNVASRVEPLAGSHGGICLSEPVYQDVRGKVEARMQAIGNLELKNRYSVRLYRVQLPWHQDVSVQSSGGEVASGERPGPLIGTSVISGPIAVQEASKRRDFVIITTASEEFDAVISRFQLKENENRGGTEYFTGVIPASQGPKNLGVACVRLTNPGNLSSKSATEKIVADLHPSFILLVGIAGGIQGRRSDITLGDVVVSRAVWYDAKKQGSQYTEMYWGNLEPPSKSLRDSFHRIEAEKFDWWRALGPRPGQDPSNPKAVESDIMSGETLRGNPNSEELQFLIERFPEAIACEMEAAGVANALWEEEEGRRKPGYLVVKGISDWVNAKSGDNQQTRDIWRVYASQSAAELAYSIVSYTEL